MSDLGSATPSTRRRAKLKPYSNGKPDPQQELLHALQAMRSGDFSVRMTGDHLGIEGKIADTFNEIVAANQRMAQQLERVGQVVGREGKTRQRVKFGLASGSWADMEGSVNTLIDDLLWPTREVTRAVAAVAQGDLLQTVQLDVDGRPLGGEFLQSANIVNTMIKQLSVFTSEVTRVAREVGTEGKLGGQAQVPEVTGVWKDLTESVNSMANNLTGQVRNIAEVTIAVANGDLSKKITVDVRGEILQLKEAINTMVDQLRSFASEVTRVAREVGTDGKLGGQAIVPGVAGTWKDLTDSVNAMCGNLTAQVRNIANVTTAVARGDLSRKITVDVRGEILELKDTINTMVDQLNSFASRSDPRRPRSRHRRQARRPGPGARRRRHLEGPHRQRQLHGVEPDRAGPQHRRRRDRDRRRRPLQEDHRERVGRNPAAEGNAQHHGRPAQRLRRRSDARGARGRHRRPARRPGQRARRRRHLEGPDRQRQLDGVQPDRAGPQHRRSDDRGRQWRPVEEDHGRRARRNSRAEGHHQHHGRPAQRLRRRSDARGARGRHRRQARRPGAGARRRRHLEGPHRQRQLDGLQPDRPGPQHRRSRDRRGQGRPVEEDHGERVGRNPAVEGNAQHHGRPAQRLCRRSDARGARGRHRRQARRPGRSARRRRHLEGPHRQRQLDGRQPHRPGPQHRRSRDRDRRRRPVAQDHGRRARRNPAAQGNAEHDGRPAQPLRRRGDARGARGRHRRPARRPGQRARRRRHLEGPHRQRQLDGGQSDRARSATSPKSPPRWRAATCRARSPST